MDMIGDVVIDVCAIQRKFFEYITDFCEQEGYPLKIDSIGFNWVHGHISLTVENTEPVYDAVFEKMAKMGFKPYNKMYFCDKHTVEFFIPTVGFGKGGRK